MARGRALIVTRMDMKEYAHPKGSVRLVLEDETMPHTFNETVAAAKGKTVSTTWAGEWPWVAKSYPQ